MGNCFGRRSRVKKLRSVSSTPALHLKVIEERRRGASELRIPKAMIVEIYEWREKRTTPKIQGERVKVDVEVHHQFDSESVDIEMSVEDTKAAGDKLNDGSELLSASKAEAKISQQQKEVSYSAEKLLFSGEIGALLQTLDEVFDRNFVENSMIGLYGGSSSSCSRGMIVDIDEQLLRNIDELPLAKKP